MPTYHWTEDDLDDCPNCGGTGEDPEDGACLCPEDCHAARRRRRGERPGLIITPRTRRQTDASPVQRIRRKDRWAPESDH